MRSVKKIIISLVLILLLIPLGAFILLMLSPQTVLSIAQALTPYQFQAESVDLSLTTPRIALRNLEVRNSDDILVVSLEAADLTSHWSAITSSVIEASGYLQGAEIYADKFAPETSSSELNPPAAPIAIADYIQKLDQVDIALENITVHVSENKKIQLDKLASFAQLSEGMDFSLSYSEADKTLPLKGKLAAVIKEAQPNISLSLGAIDLRPWQQPGIEAEPSQKQASAEAAIDWSWMQTLGALTLNLKLDQLSIQQGELKQLNSVLVLSDKNQLTHSHRLDADLTLNEDFQLKDTLALEARWKALAEQTRKADIEGGTILHIGDESVSLNGRYNLNGLTGNELSITASLADFPLVAVSENAKAINEQAKLVLPLSLESTLAVADQAVALEKLKLQANQSDIAGDIKLQTNKAFSELENAEFSLHSKKLVLPQQESAGGKTVTNKKDRVFSNTPIDVQWLDTLNASGQWSVDQIIYDGRSLLEKSKAQLTLKDGVLHAETLIGNIAQGTLRATVDVQQKNNGLVVSSSGSLKGLLLESLALLPKDEFTGGLTDMDFSIRSQGKSSQTLASQANGEFLLKTQKGTIENNSFEIVGSDLILNLINTINPFYKKAKNTQLECAVVKSQIRDGIMYFDKSIAIKTSKMIVVADGKVDLSTEKINLGINPKARKGVGVDLASLAKFVAIQGSLTKPAIGTSAEGTLKSIASLGAAISTGGLSLLAGSLADKAISTDACTRASNAFIPKEKPKPKG